MCPYKHVTHHCSALERSYTGVYKQWKFSSSCAENQKSVNFAFLVVTLSLGEPSGSQFQVDIGLCDFGRLSLCCPLDSVQVKANVNAFCLCQ